MVKIPHTPIIHSEKPLNDHKLFIFDFDNTLYDGHRYALRLVFANLMHALRCKAERNVRHKLAGQDFHNAQALRQELVTLLAQASHISATKAKSWYEGKYLPSMLAILKKHYDARPGAIDLLKRLISEGKTVCVLSDYSNTAARLAAIGIADPHIHAFSAEEMGALKPAPRPFVEIAKQFNTDPSDTLVIGDRDDTDGEGARAAFMDYVIIDKHTPKFNLEV